MMHRSVVWCQAQEQVWLYVAVDEDYIEDKCLSAWWWSSSES